MLRCVNCGLCVQRIPRRIVSALPSDFRMLLARWINVQQQPGDVVCQACYVLLGQSDQNAPRAFGHENVCAGCGCSVSNARRDVRSHYLENNSPLLHLFPWTRSAQNVRNAYYACHRCWVRAVRHAAQNAQRDGLRDLEIDLDNRQEPVAAPVPPQQPPPFRPPVRNNTPTVNMPNYKRVANTSRRCVYAACQNETRFLIPTFIKAKLIKRHKLYIPPSARVCEQHLYANNWQRLLEEGSTTSEFTPHQLEDLIHISSSDAITFDFDQVQEMPNHICHYWTGLEVHKFLLLCNELHLGNIPRPKTSLAMFLIKLRTGESNKRLSSLFDIPRATLERRMNKVRTHFLDQFVPLHIGLQHLSHNDVIQRNLSIPNALFGRENENNERPAIVICDGTYIYIQKSSNYFYQKKTYSLHKYDNLIKPFLLVCTDGHIIDVLGPYPATKSDADITLDLFTDENGPMRRFFRANDVFILDRGFRDAIPLLRSCNYKVHKPESLQVGQRQLTTIQANKSRMVTLCRWVVEVVNGRIKRDFKLFRQRFFNRAHSHLMADLKIAAALLNRFHPLIENRPDAHQIIERAQNYLHIPNYLTQIVADYNLNRRAVMFSRINADLPQLSNFPRFQYSELSLFALGPYQVLQARSYYGEHIRQNGMYLVEVCPDLEYMPEIAARVGGNNPYLIRGRIKSRHVSRKVYYTYVLVDAQPRSQLCFDAILGYCCSCLVGNRTVGCCCHVMTIVWYLGWARHEENIIPPAPFLDNVLVLDVE